jgi:hypothetical protein
MCRPTKLQGRQFCREHTCRSMRNAHATMVMTNSHAKIADSPS